MTAKDILERFKAGETVAVLSEDVNVWLRENTPTHGVGDLVVNNILRAYLLGVDAGKREAGE